MLRKSRRRLKFNENDWEITVGESETRPKYHRILEAPREFETPRSFETPVSQPVRRASIVSARTARSGTARRLEVSAYPCLQRGAGSAVGRPIQGNLAQPLLINKSINWQARRGPGLTLRSTGAPTAGHQARAGGTRYIFTGPGLASCRCRPVTSNVRRHNPTPLPTTIQNPELIRHVHS